LIHNPFQFPENDVQQDESQPVPIEIEEEKEKIIQKEVIQTGSVSCPVFSSLEYYDWIIINR
jgi:hypothetical protein